MHKDILQLKIREKDGSTTLERSVTTLKIYYSKASERRLGSGKLTFQDQV